MCESTSHFISMEDRRMWFCWGERSLTLSSFPDRTATNREGNYFEMELMGNPQNSNEIAELFLSDLPTGGD